MWQKLNWSWNNQNSGLLTFKNKKPCTVLYSKDACSGGLPSTMYIYSKHYTLSEKKNKIKKLKLNGGNKKLESNHFFKIGKVYFPPFSR